MNVNVKLLNLGARKRKGENMTNRFKSIVADATANKEKFDNSMDHLKANLRQSVMSSEQGSFSASTKTGWLKGSLSYPWVLACTIVPALKELF